VTLTMNRRDQEDRKKQLESVLSVRWVER